MEKYAFVLAAAAGAAVILLAAMTPGRAAAPVDKTRGPTDEEIKKMTDAAPAQPRVKPDGPRRLLVFSVSPGYWHDSIPYGKKLAGILAAKTGAFEATVSDDLANFEPENLRKFDAVWFNNANNEVFLPDPAVFDKMPAADKEKAAQRDAALKKSFVEWLKGGKGLMGTHAAVAMFRKWPEYGQIVGARFISHPLRQVTLKIDDPTHPAVQAFPAPTFDVVEEIYQVGDPYSRDLLRVLVSIDAAKTNTAVKGIVRKDNDFGITWVKSYDQGRVFYCALGHEHNLFWNPIVVQHYLDGLQFALGDLKADTTPSAKVKRP